MIYQAAIAFLSWIYFYGHLSKGWCYHILYDLLKISCFCEIRLRRLIKAVMFTSEDKQQMGAIEEDIYATFLDSRPLLFSSEEAPHSLKNIFQRLCPSAIQYSDQIFISLILTFLKEGEDDEDKTITLQLKTDQWNFFVVDNVLNRAFFQFFLEQIDSSFVTIDPKQWDTFTWMIIDHCAGIHTLSATDSYTIK